MSYNTKKNFLVKGRKAWLIDLSKALEPDIMRSGKYADRTLVERALTVGFDLNWELDGDIETDYQEGEDDQKDQKGQMDCRVTEGPSALVYE